MYSHVLKDEFLMVLNVHVLFSPILITKQIIVFCAQQTVFNVAVQGVVYALLASIKRMMEHVVSAW